ncbi:MAG: hypothetical protein MJ252_12855 [archaeon]|nr:hypothetical protein [archaeon]
MYIKILKIFLVNQEEEALKRRSHTSFGKLILAKEKTAPIYSIGQAVRFSDNDNCQFSTLPRYTPGPRYEVIDVDKYKFKTSNKWRIGTAKRATSAKEFKYEHYKHIDNFREEEKNPRKWSKRVIGGAIGLDPRIKYDFREKTPGPGRYENTYKNIKPHAPTYFIGEKTGFNSCTQLVGTPATVGPGKYRVETAKYTSRHRLFPIYSIGKQKRPGLFNKNWSKNETYDKYSSMGKQNMSKKRTEPRAKIGKSTRDREAIRGVFRAQMERAPVRVCIPMPKI